MSVLSRLGTLMVVGFFIHMTPLANAQPNLVCETFGEMLIDQNSFSYSGISVRNIGDEEAGTSTLGYYLSTDQDITRDDLRIGEASIGVLGPGESETKTFTHPFTDIPNGTYYLGMVADDLGTVTESSGEDNFCVVASPRITIGPEAQPDLVTLIFDELTLSGNKIIMDGLIDYCNIGSGYAGSSHVGLYLSTDTEFTTDDILLLEEAIDPIGVSDPELCALLFFDVEVELSGIPPGEYFLGIIADHRNEVQESNEGNNVDYYNSPKVIIQGTPEEDKPNLICGNLGELEITENEVQITGFEVKNSGNTAAGSSVVGFYLSRDENITRDDIRIGESNVNSLEPDQAQRFDFNTTVSEVAAGSYFVGMVVDDTGTVPETSGEDNFCHFSSPKLTLSSPQKSNLACENLDALVLNENALFCGGISIINKGEAPSSPSKVGFYLSTDNIINKEDLRIGEMEVKGLNPGEREQGSFEKSFDGIADGSYFFGMIIDDSELEDESSENDNTCFIDLPKVFIGPEAQPDLDIQNFGNIIVLGDSLLQIEESIEVCNKGTGYIGESIAGLYLSLDSLITTEDILISEEDVQAIPVAFPEFCDEVLFEGEVSLTNIPNGTYYVGILVDHPDNFDEQREDNNSSYFSSPKVIIDRNNESECALEFPITIESEALCLQENGRAKIEIPAGKEGLQIIWDNGEIGPEASKLTYGFHTVQFIETESCQNTQDFFMPGDSMLNLPQVDFSITETDSTLELQSLANDYDSLQWKIDGISNFSEENISITLADSQVIEIQLIAYNNCGASSTTKVFTRENQVTGLSPNLSFPTPLALFPNPSRGDFTINGFTQQHPVKISLLNSLGQLVFQETVLPINGRIPIHLGSAYHSTGIFSIRVNDQKNHYTQYLRVQISR